MSGYVKIFKVKDEDKDNNKLMSTKMSFRVDNEKLLETYKTIWNRKY